jgi:hypothetical protein
MGASDTVVHIERVCCLECETTYVKPAAGGTVDRNPGCPRCGYIGWISALVGRSSSRPGAPRRFGADPRPSPAVQPH